MYAFMITTKIKNKQKRITMTTKIKIHELLKGYQVIYFKKLYEIYVQCSLPLLLWSMYPYLFYKLRI